MVPLLPIPSSFWLKKIYLSFATLLIALAALVLIGWILEVGEFVQWENDWSPVSPSAALGFIVLGAVLFGIELGYRRVALLAFAPGLLGLVTGLQNFLAFNLSLDGFFAHDFLQVDAGRMAGVVSLCFILCGLTLPQLALKKFARFRTLGLAFSGSAMMAVGGSTVLGYVLNLPAVYRWGSTTSVPPGVALLLVLLGAAVLTLAWREHQAGQPGAPAWLPMPVVVASGTLTFILWLGLSERELTYLGTSTQIAMNGFAGSLNSELERQCANIERVARRWTQAPDLSPVVWEVDAKALFEDAPGCVGVTWVAPNLRTQWVYPKRGNEVLLSLDHAANPLRQATLTAARAHSAYAMSPSLELPPLGRGFVIYAPVYHGTELAGYAGSEFVYRRFFSSLERKLKLSGNYHVTVSVSGETVYDSDRLFSGADGDRLASVFDIFDRRIRVEMSPTAENLRRNHRPLPEMALLAGLGITLLLGLSVNLARKARTGLRAAEQSNLKLVAENEERRRFEEMLKISDERLRLALDSTQIGIFEWNLPTNQLYYSTGVWAMLGYLPGVIPSTPEAWTSLIHPDDLPNYRAAMEQQLEGKTVFIDPEYRVRIASGDWRWIYARSKSVSHNTSGAPLRIIGTLQDVTARKQAEQALRESQAAARKLSLVASKTDNLVIIGRPDGTIEWVNESFERIMEYQLSEVVGRNPATFMVGPETNSRVIRRIKAALTRGTGISTDVVNYSKSGKKYHLHLEVQPVRNEAGTLENFIAIQADITARVETETNLRRAKFEADAASRAKSEFLASMSHEIRTPMNGVIGMTSLLLDTPLNRDQRDFVSTIRTSGDALLTIINDILDFSKIESGKLELEALPFDLAVCIEEALDLFSVSATTRNIELAYHIGEGVPAWVVGDVTRLRQVLVNLVNNAVKFTPTGWISITVELVGERSLDPNFAGPINLNFAVTDTGIGIPPDRMDRLFRPFSQVDSSTTRKYGGTGLGLAICHRLCALMGGRIDVTSTVGKGSTFSFTILSEAVATPPGWGLPELPVRLNYGPVLCLEDNPTVQLRLETFFRTWGAQTVRATSLAAAEKFLNGEPKPSAIMADYGLLQEAGGEVLLNRILQDEIPALLLLPTGQTTPAALTGRRQVATVLKPLRNLSLVRGVQAVFDTTPDSLPPFANAAEHRPIAQEIPLAVLLVEDNAVNQKVALRFLDRLGYRADAVANGLEALSALEARRYDLVLMDLQMPEMDGFEASRQIRQRFPADQQPKIVALTANALQGDRELCLSAGMNDYIAKPVKLHEIADAIRRQFSGSQPPFRV